VVVGCVKRRNGSLFRLIVSESPLVACLLHEGFLLEIRTQPVLTGTVPSRDVRWNIPYWSTHSRDPGLKRNGIIEEENPRIDDRAEISSTSR